MGRFATGTIGCLVLGGALGCASTQQVSLECVPREVSVFVDGREVERSGESVALSLDETHTVFFRGGGYEPQLVVLESVEGENGRLLSPPDVCSHTIFVPTRPELQMELDREALEQLESEER